MANFIIIELFSMLHAEVYSEPCQISKIKLFVKIVNGFQQLTIFAKSSTLDVFTCFAMNVQGKFE